VRTAPTVLLVWCCACALGGSQPQYDYFVLTPTRVLARTSASPAALTTADGSSIAIAEVSIPGYLDRESIVTRTDDYRVVYSKRDRWAEPLDQAFERTLRQELATMLAPVGIEVPPHARAPTYDLHVDVLRFERHGVDRVELWARWILRGDGQPIDRGETRFQLAVSGAGTTAAVASLSEAITRLANEIADRVQAKTAGARDRSTRS